MGSINWAFLTQTPKPVGETGGGMANAIVGSIFILGIASMIGVPFGIGAGIYLAEFGRNKLGKVIRFTADVLNGVPSIVIGIVGYAIVVLYQKHFSALAGGVSLAIMMVPTITRTTEEMLLLVPQVSARGGLRTGHSALAHHTLDHTAHCDLRGDHRGHAGFREGCRGNCTLALYRLRKSILESAQRSADGGIAAADLSYTPIRPMTIGIVRHGRDHLC